MLIHLHRFSKLFCLILEIPKHNPKTSPQPHANSKISPRSNKNGMVKLAYDYGRLSCIDFEFFILFSFFL